MTGVIWICAVAMAGLILLSLSVAGLVVLTRRARAVTDDGVRPAYVRILLKFIVLHTSDGKIVFPKLNEKAGRFVLRDIVSSLMETISGTEYYKLLRLWRESGMEHYNMRVVKSGFKFHRLTALNIYTDIEADEESLPLIRKLALKKDRFTRFYALMALLNHSDCDVVETLKGYKMKLGLFEHIQICSFVARRKFLMPEYARLFNSDNRSVVILAIRMARYFSYLQFAPLLEAIAYGNDRELTYMALEVMLVCRTPRAEAVALELIPSFDTEMRKKFYRLMLSGNLVSAVYIDLLYEEENDVQLQKYMRVLFKNSRVMLRRLPVLN